MSTVKDCCTKDENLQPVPSDRPDLEIKKCRVCGCRHFLATLDPGRMGLKGAAL